MRSAHLRKSPWWASRTTARQMTCSLHALARRLPIRRCWYYFRSFWEVPTKTQTMERNIPHPFSDRISLNSQVLGILENYPSRIQPWSKPHYCFTYLKCKKADIEHRSEPVEFILGEMSAWSVKYGILVIWRKLRPLTLCPKPQLVPV